MAQKNTIPIDKVVDLLGLERKPRGDRGGASFDVRCPFCEDPKYHLNINREHNVFSCVRCGCGSGVLNLYGWVKYGKDATYTQTDICNELLTALGQGSEGFVPTEPYRSGKQAADTNIEPAAPRALNTAYATLLSLPELALSEAHRKNLLGRGLIEADIKRGCYGTLPSPETVISASDDAERYTRMYDAEDIDKSRTTTDILRPYSRECIIAGIMLADRLAEKGVSVEGVPGFFKICGHWCLRYNEGMLIPTRNQTGDIVSLQTRLDNKTPKGLRYMTLSSKDLDCGPTVGIARAHFPLLNGKLSPETSIIITEGPLKADIAISLMYRMGKQNIAFIAIPGVRNTRDLAAITQCLKERGVKKVFVAFDMDKTVNISVAEAGKAIRSGIFEPAGIEAETLCWDSEYAIRKEAELQAICEEKGIDIARVDNPYYNICNMARALYSRCKYQIPSEDAWSSRSKGIDDYLLYLMNRRNGDTAASA